MDTMSPTAQRVVETGKAREAAMLAAYEAEGTDREAEMDAAYNAADAAYTEASEIHRAARRAHRDNI